jgi:hypothetical protein
MFAFATSRKERLIVRGFAACVGIFVAACVACLVGGCAPSEGETLDQFTQRLDALAEFARKHDAAGQIIVSVRGVGEVYGKTAFGLDLGMGAQAAFLFNAGDEEPDKPQFAPTPVLSLEPVQ